MEWMDRNKYLSSDSDSELVQTKQTLYNKLASGISIRLLTGRGYAQVAE